MRLIELAWALATIPADINPKKYLGMRKKVARAIWTLWNESESLQYDMACFKVYIGDFRIDIIGKRQCADCRLEISAIDDKLCIAAAMHKNAAPFSGGAINRIKRILFYPIAGNASKERVKLNTVKSNGRLYISHIENIQGKYVARLPCMQKGALKINTQSITGFSELHCAILKNEELEISYIANI